MTLPLVIDSSNPDAIERVVRSYAGKPLINSVNGKRESLDAVLPLAKKYGCAIIGLALDESGIPPTAEGRFAVAEKIVAEAERIGIPREDIVIDCLVMAVATNQSEAMEIVKAVSLVKERLGVRTVLGVSNVSFGIPQRALLNSTFLAVALGCGLDFPILNPSSARYMDTVHAFRVLNMQDEGAVRYIEDYANAPDPYTAPAGTAAAQAGTLPQPQPRSQPTPPARRYTGSRSRMHRARSRMSSISSCPDVRALWEKMTEKLLASCDALDVVNGAFIPALDVVGKKFDAGEFFLPQLMASDEAVKAGFDVVREHMGESGVSVDDGRAIVVATVKGDIHDIGKNIVKMLLENYGYRVIDLGRDVDPSEILRVVREQNVRLVGLSALMTTTVKAMEETIELLHREVPGCSVFVGGAVLTPEYAAQIHANHYSKDAADSARYAEEYFASIGP